jgi:cytidyltransferase-like protein
MNELYNQIDELMLELVDEDSETIAIVPGAFKPPHLGHLSMVKQYADGADRVIVLISSPLKANRMVGDRVITAAHSKAIWEMLLEDSGLSNVEVMVSPKPSPITATYEYIDKDGPLQPGTRLILGASKKGNDFKRWKGATKYVKPGVQLYDPEVTAVVPANKPDGEPFNATDARRKLSEGEDADEFFGAGRTDSVRSILGLESPMEEMSSMAGGAVQGYGAPLGTKKRKKKNNEYNELYLYKEVLKILTNKGVIK